jgi:AraC family transcriptional regulator of adaptative response/methylated-DNA-[protein]-cysteine methyltransferase
MQTDSTPALTNIDVGQWLRSRPQVSVGFHSTPFGLAAIAAVGGHLAALAFCADESSGIAGIETDWPGAAVMRDDAMAQAIGSDTFDDGAFRMPRCGLAFIGTNFQRDVWRHTMEIPCGSVETYSDLASRMGRPSAVRAVGTAIGRNPIALLVPCHRVVPRTGGVGGYRWGQARKMDILAWEARIRS